MVKDERDALVVRQLGEGLVQEGAALVGIDPLKEGVRSREVDRRRVLPALGFSPLAQLGEETPAVAVALQVVERKVGRDGLEPAPALGLVESIAKCSWALMKTSCEMSSAWASFLTRRTEVEKTMSWYSFIKAVKSACTPGPGDSFCTGGSSFIS
jgi:hypothetical protein